jgi:hypothetical protein
MNGHHMTSFEKLKTLGLCPKPHHPLKRVDLNFILAKTSLLVFAFFYK